MVLAVALWSAAVAPGKKVKVRPRADLKIVNVALGHELSDASGRTTLTMTYKPPQDPEYSDEDDDGDDDEDENEHSKKDTAVLCSLTPGKIEQATVDLILGDDETFEFEAVGKNTLYLTGNYIEQQLMDNPPYSDDDDEDAYDLRHVSSDVEMYPDEIDNYDDEISDDDDSFEVPPGVAVPNSLKLDLEARAAKRKERDAKKRERNAEQSEKDKGTEQPETDKDAEQPEEDEDAERPEKRLKGADGTAVPVASTKTAGDDKEKKKKKKKKDKEAKAASSSEQPQAQTGKQDTATPKAATKEIAGGIKIRDSKVGAGPQAKKGSKVSMRYIGKLEGGKIFDENIKGKPLTFTLGKGEVIKGWDEGILGMQVGGERVLTIPPSMGYGKQKKPGIPPNSTLTFECKLLNIN